MVCTSETGMRCVAEEERRWPPIWKNASGNVVTMTSRVGGLMPNRRAGIVFFMAGKLSASAEKRRQYDETNPNCMSVRVAGFGKAIKIVFEEVFVRAEERYQIMQSVYVHQHTVKSGNGNWRPTISFGDTGAFRAPAISWAFALTLPFRERMVLNASVKLFCLPCTLPVG